MHSLIMCLIVSSLSLHHQHLLILLGVIYFCFNIFGRQLHKNPASNIEQALDAAPDKAAAVWPPTAPPESYPS